VPLRLLALHGYTSHGAALRAGFAPIAAAVGTALDVNYPDAPHACSPESLERVYPGSARRPAPPNLTWCRADDQGRVYEGWAATITMLRALLSTAAAAGQRVGVLGFSQGAMVASALAAMAGRGELPPLACVVLVAGSVPRAIELQPLFERPIDLPSLHVWGSRDNVTGAYSPLLAERFAEARREIATWRGPHVLPTSGPAAHAIIAFLQRHL